MTSGSHSAASSGWARRAGTTAKVIVIGQAKPGLGLHRGHVQGRARGVGAGLLARPRQRVQLVLHAHLHQLVPGGVELDLVDAVAVAVEGAQHRLVLVGQAAPLLLGLAADEAAELGGALAYPAGALALVASTSGGLLEKTSTPSSGGGWLNTVCVCQRRAPSPGALTRLWP